MNKQALIIAAMSAWFLAFFTGYLYFEVRPAAWLFYIFTTASFLGGCFAVTWLLHKYSSERLYSLNEYVHLLKTTGTPPQGTDEIADVFKEHIEKIPSWYRNVREKEMTIEQWGTLYQSYLDLLREKAKAYDQRATTPAHS